MSKLLDKLKGGDLRSIGKANDVVRMVVTQDDFDELFIGLSNPDRRVVMRTADAIEKITHDKNFGFLQNHKKELLDYLQKAKDKELKWHLALITSRLILTQKEIENTWDLLKKWAKDDKESKIVRVNSIQGLFNLLKNNQELSKDFSLIVEEIKEENVPSLNARIRKLKKLSK